MEGDTYRKHFPSPVLPKDMDKLGGVGIELMREAPTEPDPNAEDWTGGSSVVALNERIEAAKAAAEQWKIDHPLPASPT